MLAADFIVERLCAWGVRRIFGYPGRGINGAIAAIQREQSIQFITYGTILASPAGAKDQTGDHSMSYN